MRFTPLRRTTCGCGRRHTVVTTVAILLAFGGTAVALPGKGTVDSGDIANNQVKSIDVKNESLKSADLADGQAVSSADVVDASLAAADIADAAVTAAKIATDAVGADEIAANAVGAAEIGTNAVDSNEIAAGAVGSSEVTDFALNADDVGSDTGNAALNFPAIGVNTCASELINGVNDNDIGDNAIVVTPGSGFGGLYTVGAEVQNATTFAIKVCNISAAAGDPDGAGGAVYSWVMFES